MSLKQFTPIANKFFDEQMVNLSAVSIRVYLKIARNTLGWRDKNGNMKQSDWIAHSQFGDIGVSSRGVTNAINELLSFNLIKLTDIHGNCLNDPQKRKRAKRIYYALNLNTNAYPTPNKAKNDKTQTQFLHTTKEIFTKKYKANERIPDHIRLQQILQEEEQKQTQRDNWM